MGLTDYDAGPPRNSSPDVHTGQPSVEDVPEDEELGPHLGEAPLGAGHVGLTARLLQASPACRGVAVLRATLLGRAHHLSELAADALAMMGSKGTGVLRQVAAGEGPTAGIAGRALAARRALQHSVA